VIVTMSEQAQTETDDQQAEPLPIWFFVGLILSVYGLIILLSGLIYGPTGTVLAQLRPALWWGGVILASGIIFVLIGLRGRSRREPDRS
jgi:hypothetical protein